MTDNNFTDEWCRHVLNLKATNLPENVINTFDRCLLDYTGALISGSQSSTASHILNYISYKETHPSFYESCSIIGTDTKAPPDWAAFANAAIAHSKEIDDGHRYVAGLHPGVVTFSVALALMEIYPQSKEKFIHAILAGYETSCQIGKIMNPEHRNRSFHSAGTINTLGATICAGIMLDLSPEKLQSALGLGASMASGIFSFIGEHPDVKRVHVGHAAWAGINAVYLVNAGMKGPESVLEHEEGFIRAFAPDSYNHFMESFNKNLMSDFEIVNTYFKPWEACGHSFAAIDVCLNVRNKIVKNIDNAHLGGSYIEEKLVMLLQKGKILIETYKVASILKGKLPKSVEEAQFHIPFLAAVTLVFGKVHIDLITRALNNTGIHSIVKNIVLKENKEMTNSFPQNRPCQLSIETANGDQYEGEVLTHLGTPENPLTNKQLKDKFVQIALKFVADDYKDSVIRKIHSKELLNVSEINKLLKERENDE